MRTGAHSTFNTGAGFGFRRERKDAAHHVRLLAAVAQSEFSVAERRRPFERPPRASQNASLRRTPALQGFGPQGERGPQSVTARRVSEYWRARHHAGQIRSYLHRCGKLSRPRKSAFVRRLRRLWPHHSRECHCHLTRRTQPLHQRAAPSPAGRRKDMDHAGGSACWQIVI
jgi:hypothetical protein